MQSAGGRGSGVRLRLLTPARIREGEPLRFTLRIENAGRRPATVYLQGRPPAFDVTVHDASSREVWRQLEGAAVAMVLGVRELAPGELFELEGLWPQTDAGGAQVAPGRYRLTGLLPGEPGHDLRSPSVEVDIVPAGGTA